MSPVCIRCGAPMAEHSVERTALGERTVTTVRHPRRALDTTVGVIFEGPPITPDDLRRMQQRKEAG